MVERVTDAFLAQAQFLTVLSRDEAAARFEAALEPAPLGQEAVALAEALGRVLAEDVVAPVDVPPFDRSLVDGFASAPPTLAGRPSEPPSRSRLKPR